MSDFVFQNPRAPLRTASFLLIGVGAACLLIAAMFWLNTMDRSNEIADLEAVIEQSRALSTENTGAGTDARFYKGDTPQLAQTQLQSEMQELADQHQLKLEVIRADEIDQVAGRIRLGLVLNGVVPEANLGLFLQDLSQHQPMVVVDALNLRRARGGTRGEDKRLLAIQLKLSGFALR